MGFRVLIKGANDEINLEKDSILSVKFLSYTPNDSNARATDLSVGLEISGKITTEKNDDTKNLALWSLVPAEVSDCYRSCTLETIIAGTVIRKINFSTAFIVDYSESFDTKNGTGIFNLVIRQKKEKINIVSIEGGYNAS